MRRGEEGVMREPHMQPFREEEDGVYRHGLHRTRPWHRNGRRQDNQQWWGNTEYRRHRNRTEVIV